MYLGGSPPNDTLTHTHTLLRAGNLCMKGFLGCLVGWTRVAADAATIMHTTEDIPEEQLDCVLHGQGLSSTKETLPAWFLGDGASHKMANV